MGFFDGQVSDRVREKNERQRKEAEERERIIQQNEEHKAKSNAENLKAIDEEVAEYFTTRGLSGITSEYSPAVRRIVKGLFGSGYFKAGTLLLGSGADNLNALLQKANMEQNWIIMSQLDKIIQILEKQATESEPERN